MRCKQTANRFATRSNDVDNARWQSCRMKRFYDDIGLEGAHLARFHDRSAPRGESIRNLGAYEAGVAVPRCDEASYADGVHEYICIPRLPFKIVGFEKLCGIGEWLHCGARGKLGAFYGSAILLHRGLFDVFLPSFDFRMQLPKHIDTFGLRCARERFLGHLRGRYSSPTVLFMR